MAGHRGASQGVDGAVDEQSDADRAMPPLREESIFVSMVPVRSDGDGADVKPLSPPSGDRDQNANRPSPPAQQLPRQSTAPSRSSVPVAKEPEPGDAPFSCTPVYVLILVAIFLVLLIGAITTVVDMKPEFLYGPRASNATLSGGGAAISLNLTLPL